jgi:hypothetical protein
MEGWIERIVGKEWKLKCNSRDGRYLFAEPWAAPVADSCGEDIVDRASEAETRLLGGVGSAVQ